ncbi:uncharacterized protein LOC119725371 [Patiria miniata]|uniref:Uncharacterized protein n=1 Tax=Patiria miniata TaxID=46514 RepID=A0A913ZMW4_PATMI|nr:uncharacterized protein LOC119725371 [Patiria miniata]
MNLSFGLMIMVLGGLSTWPSFSKADTECGETNILLSDTEPVAHVRAPPPTDVLNQCSVSISCTWHIASQSGSNIYVQVLQQRGKYTNKISSGDELTIGAGNDSSDAASALASLRLYYVRFLDDGRTYIVNSSLAWVNVSAHGLGNLDCVEFELQFTQRDEPGFCEQGTTLCSYSLVCLPPSAYCDAHLDCGDFSDQVDCEMCGNTVIPPLTPGTSHVMTYASTWIERDHEWDPPNVDCFWLVRIPEGSILEVNILENNAVGPATSAGSAVEGANQDTEMLFSLAVEKMRIFYTNLTSIWIFADLSPVQYLRRTVYKIKVTAFEKQGCGPGEFQCQNQQCVAETRRCDGFPDCPVKEDEYGCSVKGNNCTSDEYGCPSSGKCIHRDRVCDGHGYCGGKMEEVDCGGRYGNPYLTLTPGSTINIVRPIDVTVDCVWFLTTSNNRSRIRLDFVSLPLAVHVDTSRRKDIAKFYIGYGQLPYRGRVWKVASARLYPKVLTMAGPLVWIQLDVIYRGRNYNSPGRLRVEMNITEYEVQGCEGGKFACSAGILCINASQVCDGKPDCPEFDDEFDCGCGSGKYKCSHGDDCVNPSSLCDANYDCMDRSDEEQCGSCGDITIYLSSGSHTLTSLGYPDLYPLNTHCEWFVHAEPDYDVVVVFLEFETEASYDILSLGNQTQGEAFSMSGQHYPESVSLYSAEIWLSFTSDYVVRFTGFQIKLEQVQNASCGEGQVPCNGTALLICISAQKVCDGRGHCPGNTDEENCGDICGDTLIDIGQAEYELTSPLYQYGIYPDSLTCVWEVILASSREKLRLVVNTFHLEQSYDYLHIGVGNDSSEGLVLASLTGTTKVSQMSFESGRVWLELKTDSSVSRRGFNITMSPMDNKDELECSARCSHQEGTSLCLLPNAYCDGIADCMDESDENKCVSLTCDSQLYVCQGKQQCLLQDSVCDGKVDCQLFHDDETECDVKKCPTGCNCSMVKGDLDVKCKKGWNAETVDQLAKVTATLELTKGNMTTLNEGLFKKQGLLLRLSLRNNNIFQLKQNTFAGLVNLKSLDLSENNLAELTWGVFSELAMLQNLGIRSVPIQYIRAGAFNGLGHLRRLVLMRGDGTVSSDPSKGYQQATEVDNDAIRDLKSLQTIYVDDHRLCCDFKSLLPDDNQCINIQLESPLFNCGRLMPNTVLQVFMWILGFSALIGNLLVIAWRIRDDSGKGSKYVHSFLVLNLAMSDFLMGVYMVIIATVDVIKKEEYYLTATEWRNSALCKAAGVISVLSSEASVFFITLISVDRYLCIVHPFSRVRLQENSVWVFTASIWVTCLVASLVPTVLVTSDSDIYGLSDVCIGLPLLTRPVTFTFKEEDLGGGLGNDTFLIPHPQGSKPTWLYSIVLFLGVNLVCFLLVSVCYAAIFAKVKRSIRRVKRHQSHKDEEIKMASKMAVIVGSDFLCWMPVIILGILSQTSVIQIQPEVYAWLVVFVLPINSSLNPYLYTIVTMVSRQQQAKQALKKERKPKVWLISKPPMEQKTTSSILSNTAIGSARLERESYT